MGHASGPYGGCAQCKEQKAILSANHYNGPHYISSIVYIYIYISSALFHLYLFNRATEYIVFRIHYSPGYCSPHQSRARPDSSLELINRLRSHHLLGRYT